jgi:hypothetical protein
MTSARAQALLRSPVGLELFYLIKWRHETSLTDDELMDRAYQARQMASVYRGDYDEHVALLGSKAASYEASAQDIAARMERWWSPLDRSAQVWAHRSSGPPAESNLVTDLSQFSVETPKPLHALWTCTFVTGTVSPWLQHAERDKAARPWLLTVSADARVFEVHSPEDWWELAHAYPAKAPGFSYALVPYQSRPGVYTADRSSRTARVDPDWHALACEWDGVHVSMAGVMTGEDVRFERNGVVTQLRAWEVESTVWLRWVFTSAKSLF